MPTESLLFSQFSIANKLRDYGVLTKFKLSGLVVFSAAMTFLLAEKGPIHWATFFLTIIGGWMVTASSNAFNQVLERDLDVKMHRTQNRPIAAGRMSVTEGMTIAIISGMGGVALLVFKVNMITGILAAFSLASYVLLYTPLKRITPLSVFVGAIPGALPAMLGFTASTGVLSYEAWIVFFLQFFWQFPHFWAIAWVMDDDYKRAGFLMLPTTRRDKGSAMQTLVYAVALIPVVLLLPMFGLAGIVSLVGLLLLSMWFASLAYTLYVTMSIGAARRLMFGSFIYLPLSFILLVADKYLF